MRFKYNNSVLKKLKNLPAGSRKYIQIEECSETKLGQTCLTKRSCPLDVCAPWPGSEPSRPPTCAGPRCQETRVWSTAGSSGDRRAAAGRPPRAEWGAGGTGAAWHEAVPANTSGVGGKGESRRYNAVVLKKNVIATLKGLFPFFFSVQPHQLSLHVVVPRRANKDGVLHEAHEAPEGVAFILNLCQQGGHQVRHTLTVAHVRIKHCIVEQDAPVAGERTDEDAPMLNMMEDKALKSAAAAKRGSRPRCPGSEIVPCHI